VLCCCAFVVCCVESLVHYELVSQGKCGVLVVFVCGVKRVVCVSVVSCLCCVF